MIVNHMPAIDLDADGRIAMNCMTIIAGKAASENGCVLVGHNEDDPGHIVVRHGYVPARDWAPGSVMPAEPGLAAIPQVPHTLGFAWSRTAGADGGLSTADAMLNERGVLVCSNSMGGSREDGEDASIVRDGGIGFNLRRAIAERAVSARDGVRVLLQLIDTWGYASSGRAYTIADRDEAFMIQLVRGRHYLGARIPDDAVAVMPNHYNLHTLHDCPEMFYPDDLIDYAVKKGWYVPAREGDYSDFDFARAYQAEENHMGPRNVVRQKHGQSMLLGRPWDVEREGMPFCVRPSEPLTFGRMADILRTHYEGTPDDSERVGPGRSPHDTSVRRICTGTTLESLIVDFSVPAPLTALYIAPGRPCQLPYIALHPLLGMAEPFDVMGSPAVELERHLLSDPAVTQHTGDAWQRMRSYETLAELLYADVEEGVHALASDLTREAVEGQAQLMRAASQLLAHGQADTAHALVRRADSAAVLSALGRLEKHAAHFPLARVSPIEPVSLEDDAPIAVTFSCPGTPQEDTLVLGLSHTNVAQKYAAAIPGSLKPTAEGLWRAEFERAAFAEYVHPGAYEFCLGGRCAQGAFAGLARVTFRSIRG